MAFIGSILVVKIQRYSIIDTGRHPWSKPAANFIRVIRGEGYSR
jgi:hypothetical protein